MGAGVGRETLLLLSFRIFEVPHGLDSVLSCVLGASCPPKAGPLAT